MVVDALHIPEGLARFLRWRSRRCAGWAHAVASAEPRFVALGCSIL